MASSKVPLCRYCPAKLTAANKRGLPSPPDGFVGPRQQLDATQQLDAFVQQHVEHLWGPATHHAASDGVCSSCYKAISKGKQEYLSLQHQQRQQTPAPGERKQPRAEEGTPGLHKHKQLDNKPSPPATTLPGTRQDLPEHGATSAQAHGHGATGAAMQQHGAAMAPGLSANLSTKALRAICLRLRRGVCGSGRGSSSRSSSSKTRSSSNNSSSSSSRNSRSSRHSGRHCWAGVNSRSSSRRSNHCTVRSDSSRARAAYRTRQRLCNWYCNTVLMARLPALMG